MRDDASLRRLAEIGVDVYLLRGATVRAVDAPGAADAPSGAPPVPAVVVLADATDKRAARLLDDVARALRLARIRCRIDARASEAALAEASALVAFGEAQARAAGACLPARRQDGIGWVVVADPVAFVGNAAAKRALWSELRRILRPLRGT